MDWEEWKRWTTARIGLGRCGVSIPTREVLRFRLDHARARDAVWASVDFRDVFDFLSDRNLSFVEIRSKVSSREEYLARPDLGKKISAQGFQTLEKFKESDPKFSEEFDLSLVVTDGLSASAIRDSLLPFLEFFLKSLQRLRIKTAPITVVKNGRVAIGDEVGAFWKAKTSIVLIGERPGLSTENSLGLYLTYRPSPGLTDERRNCISNIRPGGMSFADASRKASYLLNLALQKRLSGIHLKDEETSSLSDGSRFDLIKEE
ncbi:ethanolamine ammonia-lyase subunit EutC [Leptospira gomenensis]|uniref:Ethanolamine ammonia-lyase small subunit n=1 Tax=Leptospira gomenensis TaxID=2484974 RepID=A0A5F1YAM4_9LEPT|nr:ethanolamine ammonia-lyase subunit EutC [Leptospira gomenensis]TGK32675.1 ethanolamine ammonia-lyase subunit EutC [Leptospira gomenensis]TGK36823.1 ethanolamine ammonia-lyase subunit EutC [Leptospira gomenensis]TGK39898.1 ethanolamine ammonia-lyase subunit EutC [Leptospira gomenensis]TGK58033.1 ethanolamine ammonia-lyase subunit EutC [Leptospira gomenensis]